MRPTSSLSTLRPGLGSMFEFDLEANRQKFIANRILPFLNADKAADNFGKIPIEQLLKRASVKRGPKGDYNRVDWSFTDDSYSTREYGLEGVIDQRNARQYANYFDAEVSTARMVLHLVQLEAEIRVKDLLFPGTYTPTAVSGGAWSNPSTGLPLDDVEAAVRRIFAATGIWPNAIVFNELVFRNLRRNEQILEKIASEGAGDKVKAKDVTTAMLAACFDLENVIVAKGVYNSAGENLTAVPAHIWSNTYAAVGVLAQSQDIIEPCLGHTFHWAGDGSSPGGLMETYYHEPARADIVRVRHDVHEKIKYTEMWDVISGVT